MLALLATSAALLAACSPTAELTPTPTPAFANEAEAFAAAEEVYRAYNAELNQYRAGDESAAPLDFLTGDILEAQLNTNRKLEAQGVKIVGDTIVLTFAGHSAQLEGSVPVIDAEVCLDLSDARAFDSSGTDVTVAGRSDVYGVMVTFSGTAQHLLIENYEVSTAFQC